MAAMSDICGLLFSLSCGVTSQGKECVVERGRVHRELLHRAARRIQLVEKRSDMGGTPVGGHADRQPIRVCLERALT